MIILVSHVTFSAMFMAFFTAMFIGRPVTLPFLDAASFSLAATILLINGIFSSLFPADCIISSSSFFFMAFVCGLCLLDASPGSLSTSFFFPNALVGRGLGTQALDYRFNMLLDSNEINNLKVPGLASSLNEEVVNGGELWSSIVDESVATSQPHSKGPTTVETSLLSTEESAAARADANGLSHLSRHGFPVNKSTQSYQSDAPNLRKAINTPVIISRNDEQHDKAGLQSTAACLLTQSQQLSAHDPDSTVPASATTPEVLEQKITKLEELAPRSSLTGLKYASPGSALFDESLKSHMGVVVFFNSRAHTDLANVISHVAQHSSTSSDTSASSDHTRVGARSTPSKQNDSTLSTTPMIFDSNLTPVNVPPTQQSQIPKSESQQSARSSPISDEDGSFGSSDLLTSTPPNFFVPAVSHPPRPSTPLFGFPAPPRHHSQELFDATFGPFSIMAVDPLPSTYVQTSSTRKDSDESGSILPPTPPVDTFAHHLRRSPKNPFLNLKVAYQEGGQSKPAAQELHYAAPVELDQWHSAHTADFEHLRPVSADANMAPGACPSATKRKALTYFSPLKAINRAKRIVSPNAPSSPALSSSNAIDRDHTRSQPTARIRSDQEVRASNQRLLITLVKSKSKRIKGLFKGTGPTPTKTPHPRWTTAGRGGYNEEYW